MDGSPWTFDLLAVHEWLNKPPDKTRKDPESLSPKDRKDWWSGEEIRLRTEEARGRLAGFDVVGMIVGNAFAEVRARLLDHADVVAAEIPELPENVVHRIREFNEQALAQLSDRDLPEPVRDALAKLHGVQKPN